MLLFDIWPFPGQYPYVRLFYNRPALDEVRKDVRHTLIGERCEVLDSFLHILDRLRRGSGSKEFDDRSGERLVLDLVGGGLPRSGGLLVEQFQLVG